MSEFKAISGRIITPAFMFFFAVFAISLYFMVMRFTEGMGAVANINGGFPWGIWVVYDVIIGTGLACGGYALAFTVYVFNKGKYHPLVRPALLASLAGYALGGFGAIFDMGRWWQFYNILLPWNWNFNSVMLEVGLCVSLYIIVLIIEFSPAFLEKIGAKGLLKVLNKVLFFFIALGVLLPTMHQSSLGSMLIIMGYKVDPLWQVVHFQPLLAVITAMIMGYSIVIYEASLARVSFGGEDETPLLGVLGKVAVGLMVAFVVIRMIILGVQGKIGLIFAGDLASMLFIIEMILFIAPAIIIMSPTLSKSPANLVIAATSMLFAGALYRFNAFLFTYDPGPGYSYFPSGPEIMVTLGVIAFEIMVYLAIVKTLPVLHRSEQA